MTTRLLSDEIADNTRDVFASFVRHEKQPGVFQIFIDSAPESGTEGAVDAPYRVISGEMEQVKPYEIIQPHRGLVVNRQVAQQIFDGMCKQGFKETRPICPKCGPIGKK